MDFKNYNEMVMIDEDLWISEFIVKVCICCLGIWVISKFLSMI